MSKEQEVDQSYVVLEWLTTSMQKVASNPKMLGKFLYNYTQRAEEVVDAVMMLTPSEHRGVVGELLKASIKMAAGVLSWKAGK